MAKLSELPPATTRNASPFRIFLSIQDLLAYLKANRTLSGIQRLQTALIERVLSDASTELAIGFADPLHVARTGNFWRLSALDLERLLNFVWNADLDQEVLRARIEEIEGRAFLCDPGQGDAIVVVGASWGANFNSKQLGHAKTQGARVCAFVFDVIPLTHPKLCDPTIVKDFASGFRSLGDVADLLLTSSEFNAREIRRVWNPADSPPDTRVVKLAATRLCERAAEAKVLGLPQLEGAAFVLYVATLEPRKNHAYAFEVWRRLIEEGFAIPDLVLAGRSAWGSETVLGHIQSSSHLKGRVHLAQGLGDRALADLYEGCLFTVYPSLVEGWGLPVGESLAYGKPCIASATSSIIEVGDGLVDYIDPTNLESGVTAVRRMAGDTDYRSRRQAEILENFRERTWSDVAADILHVVGAARPDAASLL